VSDAASTSSAEHCSEQPALPDQRDTALAALVLALAVAAAVCLSVFGPQPNLERARASAEAHRQLLREHDDLLQANQQVLTDLQSTLDRLRASRR
jgi:uncharacterized protein HemX